MKWRGYYISACIILIFFQSESFSTVRNRDVRTAFLFNFQDTAHPDTIKICIDSLALETLYETKVKMAVCDDKLCAILELNISWDPAGNYAKFDTLTGKPLTKFDHQRFSGADYLKLDQILRDRNSMLRILDIADLVDKNIRIRATTVDAVTGATPASLKNAVVEGAVYSSYTLWHYVNDTIKSLIREHTRNILTEASTRQMLNSENYDTQLFALKQFSSKDYIARFDLLCRVIKKSSPLIKAYIISKLPIPFEAKEENNKLVMLFPDLDGYSRSILLNRITEESKMTAAFIPLMMKLKNLNDKQKEQLLSAGKKYGISGYQKK